MHVMWFFTERRVPCRKLRAKKTARVKSPQKLRISPNRSGENWRCLVRTASTTIRTLTPFPAPNAIRATSQHTVDWRKKVFAIRLTETSGGWQSSAGIYLREGNRLTICCPLPFLWNSKTKPEPWGRAKRQNDFLLVSCHADNPKETEELDLWLSSDSSKSMSWQVK